MFDRSGPHLTPFPTDILRGYRDPNDAGIRARIARAVRAEIAVDTRDLRIGAPLATIELFFGGANAICGRRTFGPRQARADRRALARDCSRRAEHFDAAVDRILARATSPLDDSTEGHRYALLDALSHQLFRAADHRATHSRLARHDLIGTPAA